MVFLSWLFISCLISKLQLTWKNSAFLTITPKTFCSLGWCLPTNTGCFPGDSRLKNLPANAGDAGNTGSTPGSGRSPGGGNGNPVQYSCLENPHGQRSMVGYSPWGHKESDMTEHTHTAIQCAFIYKTIKALRKISSMLQSFLLMQLHNLTWEVLLYCVREVIKHWWLVNHLSTLLRCRCWFNRSGARPSLCISSKFSGNADVLVQGPHFENGVPIYMCIYIYWRATICIYMCVCAS